MHADAELGCAHVVLRVPDRGDDRNAEGLQELDEGLIGQGIATHAVRDHADAFVLAANLGHKQQIPDTA